MEIYTDDPAEVARLLQDGYQLITMTFWVNTPEAVTFILKK